MDRLSPEGIATIILPILEKAFHPYAVILFGSSINNRLRPDSDIDIAFLSEAFFDDFPVFQVGLELAVLLNRDVDLVNLSTASTVFQTQVLSTGTLIFCCDKQRLLEFHTLALKKYTRLNEERQCIFDAARERMRHDES
ncbi:nucleotidyltransferase domain-containing protein [Heliobacillus mobilis]|uniref:Nucleotidyltransferase domain-containing protein n=1 Tax=Heliobacterium mobile TaxID=28064 RepID=A0A6I3SK58_HELMO|nr:nucleotidyltransferase domain-containing protein [Heliobacterium mobile]MTV49260.1 nucleotidyltransferase domain-containing protein [Heliobacterium mobile]